MMFRQYISLLSLIALIVSVAVGSIVWISAILAFGRMTTRSNCFNYAIRRCHEEPGSYMLMRKSHFGWWTHIMHVSLDGTVTEFVPYGDKYAHRVPPLFFEGEVVTNEDIKVQFNNPDFHEHD